MQKKHGNDHLSKWQEQVFERAVGGPYQATGGMGTLLV